MIKLRYCTPEQSERLSEILPIPIETNLFYNTITGYRQDFSSMATIPLYPISCLLEFFRRVDYWYLQPCEGGYYIVSATKMFVPGNYEEAESKLIDSYIDLLHKDISFVKYLKRVYYI